MVNFKEEIEMKDMDYDNVYGHGCSLGYEEESEKVEDVIKSINEESKLAEEEILETIREADYLSKKEKRALNRIVSKRINKAIKEFKREAELASNDMGRIELDDIGVELDEELLKIKEAMTEMICDEESSCTNTYTKPIQSYIWDKSRYDCSRNKNDYTPKKDYSSDIEDMECDKKLKIKIDKKTLDEFLSESDGDNENIGIITGDNREFSDIENVIFKIVKIPDDKKKRQGAYTEADGKAISDYAKEHGIIKCGWIHTHPFTKNSTFFSGLDTRTTKEMCVLPDDYCLAVVVACEYKETNNYMKDDGKIIKEYDLEYNLGRMAWRKIQLFKEKYNVETDTKTKEWDFAMVKYDCELVSVDENGNQVEVL